MQSALSSFSATSGPSALSLPPPVFPVAGGAKARPRIALVLGSGGVRSVAAIGIVDRLAREGIRPDVIVGCSSGALFGATIACGMAPDEALDAATSLWTAELTRQKRWRSLLQLLAPRLAGFDADFALRDNRLIAERLRSAFGSLRFDQLPTPLRVVATAAATGQRVVLEEGSVVDALLASMAVPFLFPSVKIGNLRLVDGVVSDPLPVAVAHDAQVVISLGFFGAVPRRPRNAGRMAAQAATSLINNLMQARLDAARANGQRIVPLHLRVRGRVGIWETAAMPTLCEAGRAAAEACLPELWDALQGAQPRLVA
ncbi:MAG: patatin-like phospholipase family protein [Hydrogenophaga sp.]|uniref:patatin-like phospholipase family protein n=1 Tax=Hydrogenophaga sp. TaxID=1904254 RepID=UPI001D5C8CB8|nr:patatin-like phospholipase family protein [Hydrogenophaga sp.]MBX3610466.1 patatin-like phospholipase family protein [Hydrogenophaga sp.]